MINEINLAWFMMNKFTELHFFTLWAHTLTREKKMIPWHYTSLKRKFKRTHSCNQIMSKAAHTGARVRRLNSSKGQIETRLKDFHPFESTGECSSWHMQPLLALCHVCVSPQKLSVTCQNQSEKLMQFCNDVQVWTAWHQISGSVCQVPYENRCPHYSTASVQKSTSYLFDPYLAIGGL